MSSPFALLFPGQGSQSVGMGKEIAQQFPAARKLYAKADEILGFPLSRLCWEGPQEALTRTEHAQAALYVTSMGCLAALKQVLGASHPLTPAAAGGLSLGEYTALAAALWQKMI